MAQLSDEDRELLASFGLTTRQKRVVMDAFHEAPFGLPIIAREAREYGASRGNTGAGLLMRRIARGEHFDRDLEAAPLVKVDARKITGWRRTRGSHGETWIEDTLGRDVPPRGYAGG